MIIDFFLAYWLPSWKMACGKLLHHFQKFYSTFVGSWSGCPENNIQQSNSVHTHFATGLYHVLRTSVTIFLNQSGYTACVAIVVLYIYIYIYIYNIYKTDRLARFVWTDHQNRDWDWSKTHRLFKMRANNSSVIHARAHVATYDA